MADGGRPDELGLISRYFRPLATAPGALGLFDDAAIFRQSPGEDIVVSADMIVEGVHFFPTDPPESVAAKALRVNLSDLAAKGADPAYYFLSLALRADWTEQWLAAFCEGLRRDQQRFKVALAGGDTVRSSGGTMISITAIGRQPAGSFVHRTGARPGDLVAVSGTIGDSALGLLVRQGRITANDEDSRALVGRYLRPEPRVGLIPALRQYASAAIDLSDGLVGDFGKLCAASGVSGEIAAPAVPLSPAAREVVDVDRAALITVLTGGDDYEILATVAESDADAFAAMANEAGVAITFVGRVNAGEEEPEILDDLGQPMTFFETSYAHF